MTVGFDRAGANEALAIAGALTVSKPTHAAARLSFLSVRHPAVREFTIFTSFPPGLGYLVEL
jgi:hypothetical protein